MYEVVTPPRSPSNEQAPITVVCTGLNEFGRPCGKTLQKWYPPKSPLIADTGKIEIQCPRCRTKNLFRLTDIKLS